MISAGKLDQRITFQAKQITRSGIGEENITWVDHCTVWAEAIPLRGREFFSAQQMQQAVDVRFRIRQRSGLAGDMRITWRGQSFDIVSLINGTAQYAGTIEVMAVSGVRNGR